MTSRVRMTALAVAGALGLGLLAPIAAEAGSEGRRNTAIGLGAVSVYGIVKKQPVVAGLAGGGAIYSYMRSRESARKERQRREARRRRLARARAARYSRTRYARTRTYTRASTPPGWSKGKKVGWSKRK